MMDVNCRLLAVEDCEAFRMLRLRACKEESAAFLEDYDELLDKPPEYFKRYFDTGWIAGAFIDGALVGVAGLHRHLGKKIAHKGTVWGVYVAPEARGKAIARTLIEMVVAEAQKVGIERVHLSTDVTNKVTVALYQSLGFEPWGVEKHITKLPDRYVDDVVMVKELKHAS